MNLVEIRVINVDKPIWVQDLETFCLKVLDEIGKQDWSISVVLCDNGFMQELNSTYRGLSRTTDVLSFPQGSFVPSKTNVVAGDIVISLDDMKQNATNFGVSESAEIKRLLVHGVLHLAGMEHEKDVTKGDMLDLQESIIEKHGEELKF